MDFISWMIGRSTLLPMMSSSLTRHHQHRHNISESINFNVQIINAFGLREKATTANQHNIFRYRQKLLNYT